MKNIILSFVAVCLVLAVGNLSFAQNTTPPTPTNLVAQFGPTPSMPGVKLTWDAPTGPWQFKIYRSVGDTFNFQPRGMSGMRVFFDHAVMPGTTYFYYVTSFIFHQGTIIESPRSNIAQITIGAVGPHPKGTIAGTVVDDTTGVPIRNVRIRFFRVPAPSIWGPHVVTDSLGHYQALLDTGTYLIKAEPLCNTPSIPGYRPEWYDNAPDPSTATPVAVAESSLFIANFGLSRLTPPTFAFIDGTVTDTLGIPLRHASVAIMRTLQEMHTLAAVTGTTPGLGEESLFLDGIGYARGVIWRGWTDSLGHYRARVVSGRSYIAMASMMGYLPEFFDNKSNPAEADIIVVSGDTSGIDFSLSLDPLYQNSISGMVRDSLGTGVPSRVILFPIQHHPTPNTGHIRFGHTDSLGVYAIANVRTGNYFVLALPYSNYAPAFYKANVCGVHHWMDADSVLISGNITGIDICVREITSPGMARLGGRVQSQSGIGIPGVSLIAADAQGSVVGVGITDNTGNYTIDALPSGQVALYAGREGYNTAQGAVNIPPGTYTVDNVNFVLLSSGALSVGPEPIVPAKFSLGQNYPNPFNPTTLITYDLPANSVVSLKVFNLLGQEIATLVEREVGAGRQTAAWDGRDSAGKMISSGIYFYRLKAAPVVGGKEFSQIRKMVLLR